MFARILIVGDKMKYKFILLIFLIIVIIIIFVWYMFINKSEKNNIIDVTIGKENLLKKRIIYLEGEINDKNASLVVAQLLFLEKESSSEEIKLVINSDGGTVTAGFAIYDTIKFIKCDVSTIAMNKTYGMATFLLSSGTKGKRIALENSKIVMTPLSGKSTSDLSDKQKKSVDTVKNKINEIWSKNTGQDIARIINDSEKVQIFNQNEAKDYGIIDKIGFDN